MKSAPATLLQQAGSFEKGFDIVFAHWLKHQQD